MSKNQRWHKTLVNCKTKTPTQKKAGKDIAALTVAVSGGEQAGSAMSKPSVGSKRSSSLSSRSGDLSSGGSKVGGSLKRGSLVQQGIRPASRPTKPAHRLCSSRSFSSLHTSSLTAAPFMRSSRSLSRLDQRATGDDCAVPNLQVEKGQTTEKNVQDSGQLPCSQEEIRDNKDQCHGDNTKKKKRGSFSEFSSSLVSNTGCHHHCKKVKKQTTDGVHTLCATTSGMRRNWVQAVLMNVRPGLIPDVTSPLSEQKSQQPDSDSAEVVWKVENLNSCLQEHKISSWTEYTHQQQEQDNKPQPEREQRSADENSASFLRPVSLPGSSDPSPINLAVQVEGGEAVSCHQCPPLIETTQTGVTDPSPCVEGALSDNSTSTALLSNNDSFAEQMQTETELSLRQKENIQQSEVSINSTPEGTTVKKTLPHDQQTGQLVKELEQIQKEVSRLQQLNRNLQDDLQQEREGHSRDKIHPQNELPSNSSSSSEQALTLQRLQKINHDLRTELEAHRRREEEAREAELMRRVDLLAQQAQLLVTGDATALAQTHLEQDRHRFHEQQMEWDHRVASLKSQLSISEEQRKEAELRLTQQQQELQNYHDLQQEASNLQKHLQEMKTQLHANKEAQAQKEARLQKHLMLLQASQDRERRSLTANLAQAEQHSQDLQERLDMAEQRLDSLNKNQTWTRDIEEAQHQLQEELARTVSAVQKLQEEREQLDGHRQELQNQLSESDAEVGRLQNRLKTEETQYYNIEHSYERVCEELQVALGKVQQRESEIQDIQEGYEKLLDQKEQELSEVLLKMEVLGNSLEETEQKLNEVLKVSTCVSSPLKDKSSELTHSERRCQSDGPLAINDHRPKAVDNDQVFTSPNTTDVAQINGNHSHEHTRTRSRSVDPSYQYIVTAGDDPERFMSVIQLLESKLYVTEEKLRDITQRLEEHQGHTSCQDPHLCSQLTQSRATAQHLSLLLHSQAKQSQRFAQETENRCRMLVGRFHVALNIIQACRERLHNTPINISDFEKQLATVAACLQQGEKEAEKQQHESHNASRGVNKILNDESLAAAKTTFNNMLYSGDDRESVGRCLMMELFVVEKMVSVLQSQHSVRQLDLVPPDNEGDMAHRYKSIISQRIALKTENGTSREECDSDESVESAIGRVCADAELIYVSIKCQQQYGSVTQVNNQERKDLADISPPELAPYEEQVQLEGRGLEESAKPVEKNQTGDNEVEAKKQPDWLERLISRLQRRAEFLRQLCQGISDEGGVDYGEKNDFAVDLNWMQEHAKLIYLSDRLCLDLEQQFQQSETLQKQLQASCKEREVTLIDEQEALNHTLCQLQENNSVLREELERAEQRIISVENGNQNLLEDIQRIEDYHEERMKKLETEYQEKIRELQQIHEEEMKHLLSYYTKSSFIESNPSTSEERKTKKRLGNQTINGNAMAVRESYQKELENLQASCDQGFTAMEEMHRKLISDLQQQHQMEVAALLKEKDQVLQEETAATMAAIVAMRRAHKKELEKCRETQHTRESADIMQLHIEYEKEIQLLHKELEVLSVQHTQKCLEHSKLSQELQDERKSSMQYQKENQELKKKQVILRAREAEMQFLRQEARSLREELKIARMDKIYAQNKLKALYMDSQGKPHQDVNKLSEDFKFATWSPSRAAEDLTNTSDAAFLKKTEKSALTRQIRGVRSKSLKEGLSVQERMKLFDSF
ncbi:nuclear mitotic apparatus protein 1 [Mastacembelus armatus]|uniref:nuclear mitotic apparatus protein 1 n=1 Tax=Mastacembelus armatus TaxID=205130 RepID=UPI000E4641CB|nr:nuclear mitotic apparatus protein 1-like [Mastacembelus armatus]